MRTTTVILAGLALTAIVLAQGGRAQAPQGRGAGNGTPAGEATRTPKRGRQ